MALLDPQSLVREAQRPAAEQSAAFKALSAPLALLYGAAQALRSSCYDRGLLPEQRLPGRVLSVGNLVAGGTGKTPVVIALAQRLLARGRRPVILTRGYGAERPPGRGFTLLAGACVAKLGGIFLDEADGRVACLPDEARLMSVTLPTVPVIVHARRATAALQYLEKCAAPTDWLLDDGFQHRQLARDADLLLLDAEEPFGNGALLPRGTLREPIAALRRASAILFTRAAPGYPTREAQDVIAAAGGPPSFAAAFRTTIPEAARVASGLGPLLLVTGIARPERLQNAVEAALGRRIATFFVADHAAFAGTALAAAAKDAVAVLTTAKDHWRDPAVFSGLAKPVHRLELTLDLPQELCQTLFGENGTVR